MLIKESDKIKNIKNASVNEKKNITCKRKWGKSKTKYLKDVVALLLIYTKDSEIRPEKGKH